MFTWTRHSRSLDPQGFERRGWPFRAAHRPTNQSPREPIPRQAAPAGTRAACPTRNRSTPGMASSRPSRSSRSQAPGTLRGVGTGDRFSRSPHSKQPWPSWGPSGPVLLGFRDNRGGYLNATAWLSILNRIRKSDSEPRTSLGNDFPRSHPPSSPATVVRGQRCRVVVSAIPGMASLKRRSYLL